LHLSLDELLLLVKEVDRLVRILADNHGLVNEMVILPERVHFFQDLVFLSQPQVLLENLSLLLRSERQLVVFDDALPVLYLLTLGLQLNLLLNELFLLLQLIWVEVVRVVLLLLGLKLWLDSLLRELLSWVVHVVLRWTNLVIIHWHRLQRVLLVITRVVRHVLALRAVSYLSLLN
jgi:hypothetical protein